MEFFFKDEPKTRSVCRIPFTKCYTSSSGILRFCYSQISTGAPWSPLAANVTIIVEMKMCCFCCSHPSFIIKRTLIMMICRMNLSFREQSKWCQGLKAYICIVEHLLVHSLIFGTLLYSCTDPDANARHSYHE